MIYWWHQGGSGIQLKVLQCFRNSPIIQNGTFEYSKRGVHDVKKSLSCHFVSIQFLNMYGSVLFYSAFLSASLYVSKRGAY